MSTLDSALATEILHFRQFQEHFLNYKQLNADRLDQIEELLNLGCIQVSSAMEVAVANLSGWLKESKTGRDLADGSDVKYVTCRFHGTNKSAYGARVSRVHNKQGDLRVQVLNPLGEHNQLNKFYWFIIPYEEYKHITRTGNLEIPFSTSGCPNRLVKKNGCAHNIWTYEVPNFERMAISNSAEELAKRNSHLNSIAYAA